MKTCQIKNIFATVGSKFCQLLIKPQKICPRLLKLSQSGEISPNLVTLELSHSHNHCPFEPKGFNCWNGSKEKRSLFVSLAAAASHKVVLVQIFSYFCWDFNFNVECIKVTGNGGLVKRVFEPCTTTAYLCANFENFFLPPVLNIAKTKSMIP